MLGRLLTYAYSVPDIPEADTDQLKNAGTTVAGVLIATAILIFGWRLLNGTAKTVVVVLGLAWFVMMYVVPNYATGTGTP